MGNGAIRRTKKTLDERNDIYVPYYVLKVTYTSLKFHETCVIYFFESIRVLLHARHPSFLKQNAECCI
jgi:hypothetical protein